jgi:hypothetical protein
MFTDRPTPRLTRSLESITPVRMERFISNFIVRTCPLVRHSIVRRFHVFFASQILLVVICGCSAAQTLDLPKDKVLLNISYEEKLRLLTRLGFTNIVTSRAVVRDSLGTKLFISVEPGPAGLSQIERTQQLVVVTSEGTQIKPWHFPANERVTDDAKVAVWQDAPQGGTWLVRSGERLPGNCWIEDVSGDWIAVGSSGSAPWIAKLDTPTVKSAELPDSPGLIAIYANGQSVHVFTRRGWRNAEGPMKYLVYDFSRESSKPIKEMLMPSWARITLDMDPDTGIAVINDNNRFWGRSWLFDVKTGKRKWISTSDWTLIVKKDVAQKWIALTKP